MSDQSTPPTDPTPGQRMSAKEAKAKAQDAKAEAKALRPWYKRPLILLGIAAVVVIGLVAVTGGGGDDDTATNETEATETTDVDTAAAEGETAEEGEAAEEAPADDAAGVGDPVRDGNFEFVVEGVQTGVTNVGGEFGENAQGEFTIVTMSVTNIGDEPQTFFDDDQIGFNSQGQQISVDTTAGIYANEDGQGFLEEINPGNSITVSVVFDLPAGETLTAVELHDSAFSGGVEVSLA